MKISHRGGYVIVDDWAIGNARKAIKDFWIHHKIHEHIHQIDRSAIYFQVSKVPKVDQNHYLEVRSTDGFRNKQFKIKVSSAHGKDAVWARKCLLMPFPCIDEFE